MSDSWTVQSTILTAQSCEQVRRIGPPLGDCERRNTGPRVQRSRECICTALSVYIPAAQLLMEPFHGVPEIPHSSPCLHHMQWPWASAWQQMPLRARNDAEVLWQSMIEE
ncbi:hypothetical protein E4U54_003045 [Claviceps lovelessii]|nr:hypothetical protein E4U54_003045 [Claviceps lovelessii]